MLHTCARKFDVTGTVETFLPTKHTLSKNYQTKGVTDLLQLAYSVEGTFFLSLAILCKCSLSVFI